MAAMARAPAHEHAPRPRRARAVLALAVIGLTAACDAGPVASPVECAPFEPLPLDHLSLEGAREAHRRAELRRWLRFMEARSPGYTVRATREVAEQGRISAGQVCFADLYEAGRVLFEHEYSFTDGLGSTDARERPSGPFRRVQRGAFGGPETNSCTSCHWRGGPGGAGALQDDSFLLGDGDWPSSADARNPPALLGAGVVQALAREMTAELQAARAAAVRSAREGGRAVEAPLLAKGVDFGVIRATAGGAVDTSGVVGVDPDLVIRPFGWKGDFATIREFAAESLHVHMNIQSEELIAKHRAHRNNTLMGPGKDVDDPDADGVTGELTDGQLTALVLYVASLEMPIIEIPEPLYDMDARAPGLPRPSAIRFHDEWARGRRLFDEIGCATCHRPMMLLSDPHLTTRTHDGRSYTIDLSTRAESPRPAYDPGLQGFPIWLFSDLKRHDMGAENASRHVERGVPEREYQTRRLWGLAQSGPYFYDGHAPDLDTAIMAHGGEAEEARDSFATLDMRDRGALRVFLMSLRRARRAAIP